MLILNSPGSNELVFYTRANLGTGRRTQKIDLEEVTEEERAEQCEPWGQGEGSP